MDDSSNTTQWLAVQKAYDRVSKINADEDGRLFTLLTGYVAALVAIAAATASKPEVSSNSRFVAAFSFLNSTVAIVHSYRSLHLHASARFLRRLMTFSRNHFKIPLSQCDWELFVTKEFTQTKLGLLAGLQGLWIALPLTLAVITPCIMMYSGIVDPWVFGAEVYAIGVVIPIVVAQRIQVLSGVRKMAIED
jgi:hypothetical protein